MEHESRGLSGNEFLEFEVVRVEHSLHGIAKQIRVLTIVKPERRFVQIGLQMLCTTTMRRPYDAAFEK